MLPFPTPPQFPPGSTETLKQLAEYYRALVEYHHQALTLAHYQVAHIEALSNGGLSRSNFGYRNGNLPELPLARQPEPSKHDNLIAPSEPISIPELKNDGSELKERIGSFLEENRGKILQVDDIISQLYGEYPLEIREKTKGIVEEVLHLGERERLWESTPNPGCWSAKSEVSDIVARVSTPIEPEKTSSGISRVPLSEKIAKYGGLTAGIGACLSEHAPEALRADEIYQWLYPESLDEKQKNHIVKSVRKILSAECGKRWQRIDIGLYSGFKTDSEKPAARSEELEVERIESPSEIASKPIEKNEGTSKREGDGSLIAAVIAALKENAPQPMKAREVLDWIYPEGLSEPERKKVQQSISNILSLYKGYKGWIRVGKGVYLWRENQPKKSKKTRNA